MSFASSGSAGRISVLHCRVREQPWGVGMSTVEFRPRFRGFAFSRQPRNHSDADTDERAYYNQRLLQPVVGHDMNIS